MKDTSEIKWGSILSYMQMALSIAIGVAYTPLMIRLLGQSEYGLYSTVTSTISMLSILSLGFNASYVRFFSRYKKNNDNNSIYGLNSLFLWIFIIIGVIAFICGLFLTTHVELIFKDGLSPQEYEIARILLLLLTVNLTISFPASVFSTIISANEKFILLKSMGMIRTVLSPLVNLPLLLMGFRSVALVTVSLVFSLLTDAIYIYYVLVKLRCRFKLKNVEKEVFGSLFTYTLFIAINAVVDQINNNVDRVLLGRFSGTITVAIYADGANLYTYYMQFSLAISGVFTPRIHSMYNSDYVETKRDEEISRLFIRVGRLQYLVLMLLASGLVFFGKEFIWFWVGDGYDRSYYVAMLLILPATVPLIQNLGIEIQRAANKHQFRSIIYLGMALCNLAITIYLCPKYGAVGAAVGTAVALILANGIIMNVYYYIKLGINIPLFWKNIFRITLGMAPVFLLGIFIMLMVSLNSLWKLLVWIIIYVFFYVISVWLLCLNEFEKDLVRLPIKKVLGKISRK